MWKELSPFGRSPVGRKKVKRACPEQSRRVFVAMSGGVDSSVAALLLKKQGYEVVGVFMKFWHDADPRGHGENRCCSLEARRDAMRVCAKLNIPFLTWDFRKEFKKAVVDDFIKGYKKGITPNPCVVCNKEIKLGLFLKRALKMGADYIATGHYVRLASRDISTGTGRPLAPATSGDLDSRADGFHFVQDQARRRSETFRTKYTEKPIKIFSLFVAKDLTKDQSYFLWTLTQKQLKHCLFPIGDYTKEEVRALAKKYKLSVTPKESQEVCFIKDTDLYGFLKTRIHADKGDIVELKTGKKIGEHQGVYFYTIGQRAPVGGIGPYYVIGKNLKKNQLLVVKKDSPEFFCKEIILKNVNWLSGQPPKSAKILARTRYRQPLAAATLIMADKNPYSIHVLFNKPQKAAAPGQSAVFYNKNGELLGGGVIKNFI
jgi:tRNA-specific 2-thiouridylase